MARLFAIALVCSLLILPAAAQVYEPIASQAVPTAIDPNSPQSGVVSDLNPSSPLSPAAPAQPGAAASPEAPAAPGVPVDSGSLAPPLPPSVEPEVMTSGPVHEAFAEQFNGEPVPGVVVPNAPPEAVQEIPPEYKPDGENVEWVPGYWAWDDQASDFVWITGVWRVVPPGHQWQPGYWHQTEVGYQWVGGFWSTNSADNITYYDAPPETLERGPSSPAPNDDYFWNPGSWTYDDGYQWQAGSWHPLREDWVWVPARWVWTPAGCVYVAGHWDYALAQRGCLFAPIRFPTYTNPIAYQPWCTIDNTALALHLFVRPSYNRYYFGDLYDVCRDDLGYYSYADYHSRRIGYDPIFAYSRAWSARRGVNLAVQFRDWGLYFSRNRHLRPPRTFGAQNSFRARYGNNSFARHSLTGLALNQLVGSRSDRFRRLDDFGSRRVQSRTNDLRNRSRTRSTAELVGLNLNRDAGRNPGISVGRDRNRTSASSPRGRLFSSRELTQLGTGGSELSGNAGARGRSGDGSRTESDAMRRLRENLRSNSSDRGVLRVPSGGSTHTGRPSGTRPGTDAPNAITNRSLQDALRTDRGNAAFSPRARNAERVRGSEQSVSELRDRLRTDLSKPREIPGTAGGNDRRGAAGSVAGSSPSSVLNARPPQGTSSRRPQANSTMQELQRRLRENSQSITGSRRNAQQPQIRVQPNQPTQARQRPQQSVVETPRPTSRPQSTNRSRSPVTTRTPSPVLRAPQQVQPPVTRSYSPRASRTPSSTRTRQPTPAPSTRSRSGSQSSTRSRSSSQPRVTVPKPSFSGRSSSSSRSSTSRPSFSPRSSQSRQPSSSGSSRSGSTRSSSNSSRQRVSAPKPQQRVQSNSSRSRSSSSSSSSRRSFSPRASRVRAGKKKD